MRDFFCVKQLELGAFTHGGIGLLLYNCRQRDLCRKPFKFGHFALNNYAGSGVLVAKSATSGMSETNQTQPPQNSVELPLSQSVGYQIRTTHRLIQRYLQLRISPHRVTLGMWYFLRVLWNEDGLTQRELSNRVGAMEPTTLSAIQSMESRGFVKRVRDSHDRRKWNIFLTEKGHAIKKDTLPIAADVVSNAIEGFSEREVSMLLSMLGSIQNNIQGRLDELDINAE